MDQDRRQGELLNIKMTNCSGDFFAFVYWKIRGSFLNYCVVVAAHPGLFIVNTLIRFFPNWGSLRYMESSTV